MSSTTPLHEAAYDGDAARATHLLKSGCDIEADNVYGGKPLHCAASYGHKVLAELLLEGGAQLEAKADRSGWRPLHVAAASGHKTMVQLLVVHGANCEALTTAGKYKGMTAAELAQTKDHIALAQLLRDASARLRPPTTTSPTAAPPANVAPGPMVVPPPEPELEHDPARYVRTPICARM
jgi:ankyrin repeat protein